MTGRILALGGGGFSSSPPDPALDRYVLDVAGTPNPRVCLLPTASGDTAEQIARFHRAFRDLPCEPADVSLFRLGARPLDLRSLLLSQDVIYVGGGSLLNLLAIWRAHALDAILREAWESGILLCGISAGSMCWFRAGVTKSHGPPRVVHGLGFLPASNSVHWSEEPDRRPCFREAIASGGAPAGWGVDDGAALLFAGTELVEAVSARASARAHRVELAGDGLSEEPLDMTLLEPPDTAERVPLPIAELRELRERRAAGRGLLAAPRLRD